MFRSLRPKPLEPLPLPFRDRRAEREAERRKAVERFASIEMDRTPGFSWNSPRTRPASPGLLVDALTRKLGAALFAGTMGVAIVAVFLFLSRVGLPDPPPRIIYVEDWSGRIDPRQPIPRLTAEDEAARRAEGLERERAAARAASPER